jgi:hypothetical protein
MRITSSGVYYYPKREAPWTKVVVKLVYEHEGVKDKKRNATFKKADDLQLLLSLASDARDAKAVELAAARLLAAHDAASNPSTAASTEAADAPDPLAARKRCRPEEFKQSPIKQSNSKKPTGLRRERNPKPSVEKEGKRISPSGSPSVVSGCNKRSRHGSSTPIATGSSACACHKHSPDMITLRCQPSATIPTPSLVSATDCATGRRRSTRTPKTFGKRPCAIERSTTAGSSSGTKKQLIENNQDEQAQVLAGEAARLVATELDKQEERIEHLEAQHLHDLEKIDTLEANNLTNLRQLREQLNQQYLERGEAPQQGGNGKTEKRVKRAATLKTSLKNGKELREQKGTDVKERQWQRRLSNIVDSFCLNGDGNYLVTADLLQRLLHSTEGRRLQQGMPHHSELSNLKEADAEQRDFCIQNFRENMLDLNDLSGGSAYQGKFAAAELMWGPGVTIKGFMRIWHVGRKFARKVRRRFRARTAKARSLELVERGAYKNKLDLSIAPRPPLNQQVHIPQPPTAILSGPSGVPSPYHRSLRSILTP